MKTVPASRSCPSSFRCLALALMFPVLQGCATPATSATGAGVASSTRAPLSQEEKNQIGQSVVLRLRSRYADTRRACPGDTPGYNCNGVLIRGLSYWDAPEWWNVVDKDIRRDGVSFSYLRADVGTTFIERTAGLIMREMDADTQVKLSMKCAFPHNAQTDPRPDGCSYPPHLAHACHQMRVMNVESWLAHTAENSTFTCYFAPTTQWFQLSIDVRQHPDFPSRHTINEVIIRPWPAGVPEQLPMEAVWFSGDQAALDRARVMQDAYIRHTGRFLPIVRVEAQTPEVFFYVPREQVERPAGQPTISVTGS